MPKFSRTQRFTKANIANVLENKAIIYKIKSKSGENLYTGICWTRSPAGQVVGAQGNLKGDNFRRNEISICVG